jgi:hypothetical protein
MNLIGNSEFCLVISKSKVVGIASVPWLNNVFVWSFGYLLIAC